MTHPETKKTAQVRINATDEVLSGQYANVAQITHTQEEFVLDFMTIFPPQGTLASRIILSPGHMKRIVRAMDDNIQKYEVQFGAIVESDQPDTQFGFPIRDS
jgi:hypothetical protein